MTACLLALAAGGLVGALGPGSGGGAVAVALFMGTAVAWAWRRPEVALAALALAIPVQVRLNLPGAGALAIGFLGISGLAGIVFYREYTATSPSRRLAVSPSRLPWGGCLYLVAATLSLWMATELGDALRRGLYLAWFVLLFWLVPRCVRDEPALQRVLRAIAIASAIAAVLGLLQFALQFVIGTLPLFGFWVTYATPILEGERVAAAYQRFGTNWMLMAGGRPFMRAIGTFSGPPDVAQYLGVCLPIAMAYWFGRPRLRARAVVALGILALFLACTFSRQAWLGMLLALPAMYLAAYGRSAPGGGAAHLRRRLGYTLAAAFLLPMLLLAAAGSQSKSVLEPVVERLLSIGDRRDTSNLSRVDTWIEALDLTERHPILGVGLGNYAAATGGRAGAYSHNTYLDVLVETGPLGLLGLLGLLGWAGTSAWRTARRGESVALRSAGVGFLGAIVALAVIFCFDDAFYFPRAGQAFWLLLGLIAASRDGRSAPA